MEGGFKNDGKEDVGTNADSWGQKGTNVPNTQLNF